MPSFDPASYLQALDREMRAVVTPSDPLVSPFYDMLQYHLGWRDEHFQPVAANSGKRLRPLFCLLTAEALGSDWHAALPAAAAVEILHNFSLVHDDIEDNDRVRRHRPTLWTLVGVPHAINAGDALFMLAQRTLVRLPDGGVSAERTVRVSRIFQDACLRLVEGQFLDMHAESLPATDETYYLRMIAGKTAALLGAAAAIGAAVATDDSAMLTECQLFGQELGLSFQMSDDLLGLWGDPEMTGKPAGADLRRRKKSLPVVLAQKEKAELAERIAAAFRQSQPSDDEIGELLRAMERAGIRERVQSRVDAHLAAALDHWRVVADGAANLPACARVADLATELAHRDR